MGGRWTEADWWEVDLEGMRMGIGEGGLERVGGNGEVADWKGLEAIERG